MKDGMFVAQVRGDSMNEKIPDGAWCLFGAPPEGSRAGRVVAVCHARIDDPDYGGSFTVKQYHSEKVHGDDGGFRHSRIELRPLSTNPAYRSIVLMPEDEGEVRVLGEFLEVLGREGA